MSVTDLPSNVRGCNITQPVCTYSTSCRNTSASNSSIIITVEDAGIFIVNDGVPTALPRLYFDQVIDVLVPEDVILLLFLMLFRFGGDFCCCYSIRVNKKHTHTHTQSTKYTNKTLCVQISSY